jgi:SHS2 domain-containing protein
MSTPPNPGLAQAVSNFEVELPAGGKLHLQTIDEVELFETSRDRYLGDYKITNQSDKLAVGNLLLLQVEAFRAAQRLNGMEPELDPNGVPTGRYMKVTIKAQDRTAALGVLMKTRESIADTEKALGIDKKTRDQGGQYDVSTYIQGAKSAAREFGVHLSKRYVAYVTFVMELRTQLRMLRQLDAEDLMEMKLTPETLLEWCWQELSKLEEADKKFAHEKGKLIVGRVR